MTDTNDLPDLEVGATYRHVSLGDVELLSLARNKHNQLCVLTKYGAFTDVDHQNLVRVQTYPEGWANVYAHQIGSLRNSEESARNDGVGRIGVLHLLPDGTTEMLAP